MTITKFKASALGLAALAVMVLPSTGALATSANATTTINANIGSVISVASTGTVSIDVTPVGASNTISSASDTVTVNTNNAAGYNLTLAMNTATRTLAKGADTIDPSTGTLAAPIAPAVNTWGYRVDGLTGFGAGPASALNNATTTTLTFAGVPATATPDEIKTTTTTATNDTTTVWYMVAANNSKPNGIYTNTVVYTATTK